MRDVSAADCRTRWRARRAIGSPMRIAIMQGRLLAPQGGRFQCFPRDCWREEFSLAAAAGLDAIEWIYDLQGADENPIATSDGIDEIITLARQNGIAVASICADYFMDRPFVGATKAEFTALIDHLQWLLTRARMIEIERIVLPFVDNARMESAEQQMKITEMLRQVIPCAAEAGTEIHLETSLAPDAFERFLGNLPHSFLKVTYDSGNSASVGYDVQQELAVCGG